MNFAHLQQFLIAAVVFVPLERLFALRKDQKILRDGLQLDLMHVVATGMFVIFGLALVIVASTTAAAYLIPASLQATIASQPRVVQFLEVLLIADLCFYLVHRAFHAVPFLWRIHSIHHSIEQLDWVAAHRVHPLDQIATKGGSLIPIFLLGFDASAILAFGILYRWQALLIHSNVRIPFGPLRWLLASPQFHHWHHADHPEAIDRNFAGQLAFLDFLFGTAYLPDRRMPETYGTSDPVPKTYGEQLAHPFRVQAVQNPEPVRSQ